MTKLYSMQVMFSVLLLGLVCSAALMNCYCVNIIRVPRVRETAWAVLIEKGLVVSSAKPVPNLTKLLMGKV